MKLTMVMMTMMMMTMMMTMAFESRQGKCRRAKEGEKSMYWPLLVIFVQTHSMKVCKNRTCGKETKERKRGRGSQRGAVRKKRLNLRWMFLHLFVNPSSS